MDELFSDWDINEEKHADYLKIRLTNGSRGEGITIYLKPTGHVHVDVGTKADISIRRNGKGYTLRNPV